MFRNFGEDHLRERGDRTCRNWGGGHVDSAGKATESFRRFGLTSPANTLVVVGLPLPNELVTKLGNSLSIRVSESYSGTTRYKLLVSCIAAYMFGELGMEAKDFATTQLATKLSRMLGVASDKKTGSYLPGRGAIRAALGVKFASGGFKGQQATFGVQTIQTVARIAHCANCPIMACLFVDIQGAYHFLVRELLVGPGVPQDVGNLAEWHTDTRGLKKWLELPGLLERVGPGYLPLV